MNSERFEFFSGVETLIFDTNSSFTTSTINCPKMEFPGVKLHILTHLHIYPNFTHSHIHSFMSVCLSQSLSVRVSESLSVHVLFFVPFGLSNLPRFYSTSLSLSLSPSLSLSRSLCSGVSNVCLCSICPWILKIAFYLFISSINSKNSSSL